MGKWQFRRSKKIFPGVRLNFSKKGIGISAGIPGARVSLSPDKKRLTFSQSIPGTGLRKQETVSLAKFKSDNQYKDYNRKSKYKELFRDGRFNDIYESSKTSKYRLVKKAFIFSFLLFIGSAFLPFPAESEIYGGMLAFIFFILLALLPIYFVMRGKLLKNARKKFMDEMAEQSVQEEKKMDFDSSMYMLGPKDNAEKEFLIEYYERACELIKIIRADGSHNGIASEIEVSSGEAVFFKCSAILTNYDAIDVTDSGFVYVTNKRVIFLGLRKMQEWEFAKMPTPLPDDEKQVAVFQVSNRKTVTGVKINLDDWLAFKANLLQAFAIFKYPEKASIEFPETLQKIKNFKF